VITQRDKPSGFRDAMEALAIAGTAAAGRAVSETHSGLALGTGKDWQKVGRPARISPQLYGS
jgi:hypothetical protein